MHTRVAGRLNICSLCAGPVFIVAHGKEYFVIGQTFAVAIRIDSGGVGNIVAILPPTSESWDTQL